MTQGKIERYHRSMKNEIRLRNYEFPWELETSIRAFVEYYNTERYHESLDNLTPEDVYFGRGEEIQARREEIKRATMRHRGKWNLGEHDQWPWTINLEGRILS
jgi:putative transposase